MLPAQVSYWTLRENERHNKETERLSEMDINERIRHNQQDEAVRRGQLAETQRNNLYVNAQGDRSLGLNALDTETRKFSAVSQASIGSLQARASMAGALAAQSNAQAALQNAKTNLRNSIVHGLNETRSTTARTKLEGSQVDTESAKQSQLKAQAAQTEKETSLADFYAGQKAAETEIKQQEAYTHMFGKMLDNMTPWE